MGGVKVHVDGQYIYPGICIILFFIYQSCCPLEVLKVIIVHTISKDRFLFAARVFHPQEKYQ